MDDKLPSVTARRVAAYRLAFKRVPALFGDPAADERLARDVVGAVADAPHEPSALPSQAMKRYLRARTVFFDRLVVDAVGGGMTQILCIGAGYDGRAFRYAMPGVRWWEIDQPSIQADKRERLERLGIDAGHVRFVTHDIRDGGLAAAVLAAGYEPDAPFLALCEGVIVYLDPLVVEDLLHQLRSLSTIGSRLAISTGTAMARPEQVAVRARFRETVAALGEPVLNTLAAEEMTELLARCRWRSVKTSERSHRAGFVIATPV
jgi:methyltransferase (TIGR00027 family)